MLRHFPGRRHGLRVDELRIPIAALVAGGGLEFGVHRFMREVEEVRLLDRQ
jgi:hypothetical protein